MINAILLLLLSMISIQFGASQAKQLFSVLGVSGTAAMRLFFASLMMALIFRPWRGTFNRYILFYGVSLGLMNYSFYQALERIPLGIAVALEFMGPLGVAVFSSKRKIDYLWAVLAAVGIILLLPSESSPERLDPIGIILALTAGLCWGLYIIIGKKAGQDQKGGIIATMGMIIATLIVIPFGIVIDGPKLLNVEHLPAVLMVAAFGSALPYSLEMVALKKLPSQMFGILMSLEPAMAALMGFVFLAEKLTLLQWAAIFCVMISSVGSSWSNSRQ